MLDDSQSEQNSNHKRCYSTQSRLANNENITEYLFAEER